MNQSRGTSTSSILALISFAILCGLSLFTLYHHALWRDEYQAWLIAYASNSIPQVFSNLQHEGHPGLWHLALYLLQSITDNVNHMKLLNAFISLSTLFLVFFASPFSLLQRLLICSSAALSFEYFTFSRSYSSGVLFLFVYCSLSQHNRLKHVHFARSLALGLAAVTSVYGLFLATALAVHHAIELRHQNKRALLLLFPFVLGGVFCILTIIPSHNTAMPKTRFETLPVNGDWSEVSSELISDLDIDTFRRYMLNEFPPHLQDALDSLIWTPFFPFYISSTPIKNLCLLLFASIIILLYREKQFPLYIFGIYLLLAFPFYLFIYQGHLRHFLMVYIAFVSTLWLSKTQQKGQIQRILICLLSLQTLVGLQLHYQHNQKPYSMLPKTLNDLRGAYTDKELEDAFLIGMSSYNTSGFAAHLKRPLYNPTRDTMQYFQAHDKDSFLNEYNVPLATRNIFYKIQDLNRTVILITNFNVSQDKAAQKCLTINTVLEPTQDTYDTAERFWVYELQAKHGQSCPANRPPSLR